MRTVDYKIFHARNSKKANQFISKNCFFAFSKEQFAEGCAKFGVAPEEAKNFFYQWVGGGFILKTAVKEEQKMWKRHAAALRKYLSNYRNLVSAIRYEIGNHECCYTGCFHDALEALGLESRINKDKRIQKAFLEAKQKAIKADYAANY